MGRLRLRPAQPDDLAALCDVYFSAFSDNLVQQMVFPATSPEARNFWHSGLSTDMQDPNSRLIVVVEEAVGPQGRATEQIIAFAKWMRPMQLGETYAPGPALEDWPRDGDPEFGAQFFGSLAMQHEEIMKKRPHWYLECIATSKEHQGRGAGGMLVRWGVERADRDGVESYLDSTAEGRGLYVKHGFREIKRLWWLGGSYSQCFMIRDK
ncbi:uncharacterized protein E0L32_001853 [Thyridium curvatum]|uniref:N-acetyltransferase domain-containing protein n=1 Tax=Thyridium curvatum TaxID=1093900 RepID=A0A507ATL4_9PEZI|nr:uncharacterized protein E0L32_001826 [Thyridium curvatum]XP_030989989.1 uncharacterized protein E0L32_001853 [Thyridium curvatum]TPX08251.1 hypothetical protein E0L32_001826 [Thyridium curvatum]TPX08278.1 hypothetical protein E0L32_001853 [Thyridium curvatum]